MTNETQVVPLVPFNYDNFQKLYQEVVELRALALSLAAQLEKAQSKKE